MSTAATVTLCGPQRLKPTIGAIAKARGIDGKVAIITAGWRERELGDQELRDELQLDAVNLRLYARWREIAEADSDYFELHRARQDKLRRLQEVYRRRLRHMVDAVDGIAQLPEPDGLFDEERLAAIDMIAELDRHHLRRVKRVHVEFERDVQPAKRRAIAAHREEVAELLDEVDGVFIAGGHIAVLLNRLRLLAVRPALAAKHVVAWSAGAMAVTSHVLLFHDSPPWGRGNAEVLDHGLGLATGAVALPHAYRRLDLDDAQRVASMARRADPSRCLVLPDGAHVSLRDGEVIDTSDDVRQLTDTGDVRALVQAEAT